MVTHVRQMSNCFSCLYTFPVAENHSQNQEGNKMKKQSTNCIFESPYLNESENSTNYLTIPDSLITYARDTVFSAWQSIERQLAELDHTCDPEMYKALNERGVFMFNIWLMFTRLP